MRGVHYTRKWSILLNASDPAILYASALQFSIYTVLNLEQSILIEA